MTLAVSTSSTSINTYVTLTGKVSPGAKGKTVSIERKLFGGSWKSYTSATLSSTSTFSKKIKLTAGGTTSFRARKASGSGHAAGTSTSRNVSVYRWRYLRDLSFDASPVTVYDGSMNINGFTYSSKSFSIRQGEHVDWNLNGKFCNKIRGYIGIDDDSDSGTTGYALITNQGFSIFLNEQDLAKGQSARWVHANLASSTIRFLPSVSNSTGWVSYADMQVSCNS